MQYYYTNIITNPINTIKTITTPELFVHDSGNPYTHLNIYIIVFQILNCLMNQLNQ